MARVFITGVNGFIGAHLAEALLARGDEVTGLVRATSDTRALASLFERHGDRFRLVIGDLRRPETLGPGLAGAEFVFHLAAVLLAPAEQDFVDANVVGTRNLFAAVRRHGGPGVRRVVFTSSMAAAGPSPDGHPLAESEPVRPVSWYGRSKADAEAVAREFMAQGLPITVVRPVSVYGERERDFSGAMFPPVSMGVRPMVGLARKTLSMVYVGDLVAGLIAAAESPAAEGRTYFLGDPEPYLDTHVARTAADALGTGVRIPVLIPHAVLGIGALLSEVAMRFTRERPAVTRDKVREVRQRWWAASPAAAQADFGWRAQVPLIEGMRRAAAEWRAREAAAHPANEPLPDRAIKAYLLAIGFGVVVEGVAKIGNWYEFHPQALVFVIIFAIFGGVMGSVALFGSRLPAVVQFIMGAAVGTGAELLNYFFLHRWTFSEAFLARLPSNPWLLALSLGLPAGLMPILVNAIARSLHQRRLRLG